MNLLIPNSCAREIAADNPRALNDPVGLTPSSLTKSLSMPNFEPSLRADISGVQPSPNEMTFDESEIGITSR